MITAQTTAQITIDAAVETIFDASIDRQNLPRFFTGYQAIPAIVRAERRMDCRCIKAAPELSPTVMGRSSKK